MTALAASNRGHGRVDHTRAPGLRAADGPASSVTAIDESIAGAGVAESNHERRELVVTLGVARPRWRGSASAVFSPTGAASWPGTR